MIKDIYASLISITKGIHKDTKNERDYKELNNKLKNNIAYKTPPLFTINFSEKDFGDKRKYYKKLIDNETCNKFNKLIDSFPENTIEHEHIFNYQIIFNQFKQNLIDINNYIKKYNYDRDTIQNEDTFIIQYLKANMILLYLELQERFAKYGDENILTIKEIYKYFFNEVLNEYDIIKNYLTTSNRVKSNSNTKTTKKLNKKVSFGYLKEDKNWLLKILKRLQFTIDLLDTSTDVEDLHKLLLTHNFNQIEKKIYLDCKTTEFKYVVNKLKRHFKNLNPTIIEATGLFYTKSGKPLTAQNLYSKNNNPLKKESIDNIFKQIQ
ncbi:hypothetical protein MC378_03820 [Polaribacter sp. MSW13]|uniref:Uncharacterized protein n=1 Tax=Polaribacter marinus TaxID=2916838 RepID=A0A9X2AJD4_9FLAO|nr:DUF6617 family protein [Polaribacter marinus]MCI2228283.1 hypothetical protein [Polaribacter marinus]